MDHPDVRQVQDDDREVVGDLWSDLLAMQGDLEDRIDIADDARERWENDFSMWVEDETARMYVAEDDDGTIVGFVSARRWGPAPIYGDSPEVYLDELYVRSEWRREGYGTQLVNAVRSWADHIGARRVRLRVLTCNADGRAFWAGQDAIPLSMTLAIESNEADESTDDEGTKKIGFRSERTS